MDSTSTATKEPKLCVHINGEPTAANNIPGRISKFVRPALFTNYNTHWEARIFGTSFFCKYRGLHLAIVTNHQVGDGDKKPLAENFFALEQNEDGAFTKTPKAKYHPLFDKEEDASLQDLCIFEFDNELADGKIASLDLDSTSWPTNSQQIAAYSFLIGYRSEAFDAEIDEEGKCCHFKFRWTHLHIAETTSGLMDTENRIIFKKHPKSAQSSGEPDGLSGSPVFSIVCDAAHCCHLRFDGIVTNAREDRFAVYPSTIIRDVLDKIADASEGSRAVTKSEE